MTNRQIPNLPSVISLNGTEEFEAVQNGVSVKVTAAQIAALQSSQGVTFLDTTAPISGGPITATGTLALAPAGVTNAYLDLMAAYTVKANLLGATAAPTDAGISAVLDMISATQGAVLYRGAASWAALTPGVSGQVLQTQGASADPVWVDAADDLTTIGRPWLTPASGQDMLTSSYGGAMATATGTINKMVLFPFYAPTDISFSALKMSITSASGAGNAKLGFYSSDVNGRINVLLGETANIPTTATGFFSSPLSGTLEKGKTYWFFARFSSVPTYRVWNASATPAINGGTVSTGNARSTILRTVTFASAAPSPWVWDATEIDDVGGPAIWMVV